MPLLAYPYRSKYTPGIPRGFWRRHYNMGADVVDGEVVMGAKHDPYVDVTIRHVNGLKITVKTRIKSFFRLLPPIEKATEEDVQKAIEDLLSCEDVSEVETPMEWRNF